MGKRERRGITLAEMLIASAVFFMLSWALHQLMVTGTRFVRKSEVLLDLQKESLMALTWIHNEMSESGAAAFDNYTVIPDGSLRGVVFASPRDLDNRLSLDLVGRIQWQRVVAYYLADIDGVPCLVRKQRELTPSAELPVLPTLNDMVGDGSLPVRVLARHVTEFQGEGEPDENTEEETFPIAVVCTMDQQGREYAIRAETSIFFRN